MVTRLQQRCWQNFIIESLRWCIVDSTLFLFVGIKNELHLADMKKNIQRHID